PRPLVLNYYMESGLAYTEDRVAVRRVKFSCQKQIAWQRIRSHFEGFGLVEELHYQVPEQRGSVLYKKANQACQALYSKYHWVGGEQVTVIASPSWEQPEEEVVVVEEAGSPTVGSAEDLPPIDDALRQVLHYLPLDARIAFAISCRRFWGIYELESRTLTKNLSLTHVSRLTRWGICSLMRASGPDIRRLEGGPLPWLWPHFEVLTQMLGPSCRELKELHLTEVRLHDSHLHNLFQRPEGLTQLTSLSLKRCQFRDQDLFTLRTLAQLQTLDLSGNVLLRGDTLGCLPPSVVSLNLTLCENLKPDRLPRLGALPDLRELRCPMIGLRSFNRDWLELVGLIGQEPVYACLAMSCPRLELLEISACPNLDEEQVARLPRLRTLIVNAVPLEPEPYQVNDDLLRSLANSESLRHLELGRGEAGFVSSASVVHIGRLKQLEFLLVRNLNGDDLLELRYLIQLQHLDISDTLDLDNGVVKCLVKALVHLRHLMVQRCPLLTEAVIPHLQKVLLNRQSLPHGEPILELDV
ncbi:hypothetical protein KR009_009644, partial [Drosophila setifemur]